MDTVIAEAEKHGIRLILSLVNNDSYFGGRPQYVKWAQGIGENVTSVDEFYTNKIIKQFYKNYTKVLNYTTNIELYHNMPFLLLATVLLHTLLLTNRLNFML